MRLLTLTAIVVFALDQTTKYAVVHWLDLWSRQRIDVFPPYLNFVMAWNQGINFGLFATGADLARWLLILLAVAISGFVAVWAGRGNQRPIVQIASGAVIGGAMGNVVDRLLFGAVADFLNMSVPGIHNPYSFNIADIAVFAGAFALVIFGGREKTP
jgi:signal peptidase II